MKRISVSFNYECEDGCSMYVEGEDRMTCILNAGQFLRDVFNGRHYLWGLSGLFSCYKAALAAGYKDSDYFADKKWAEQDDNEYIGNITRMTADGGDDLLTFDAEEGNRRFEYMGDWAFRDGPTTVDGYPDIEFWANRIEEGVLYRERYEVTPRKEGSEWAVMDFATYDEASKYADLSGGWARSYIVGMPK